MAHKITKKDRHLVLSIEIPAFYTEDIDIEAIRRDCFEGSGMSDSEILLNHIGEPGLVRLVMEISGEKEGDVVDVLGCVRAWKLQPDQDELIEHAVRKLRRENVPLPEIIDLLEGEVAEVRRWIEKDSAEK